MLRIRHLFRVFWVSGTAIHSREPGICLHVDAGLINLSHEHGPTVNTLFTNQGSPSQNKHATRTGTGLGSRKRAVQVFLLGFLSPQISSVQAHFSFAPYRSKTSSRPLAKPGEYTPGISSQEQSCVLASGTRTRPAGRGAAGRGPAESRQKTPGGTQAECHSSRSSRFERLE